MLNNLRYNKKYLLIILMLLFFLIIGLIGMTYSWFNAIVSGNDKIKETKVEAGKLSIKYTNNSELKGENIVPGWSETKTFTVENTGTILVSYNIIWKNLLNEFVNKEDLVYTLTSDNRKEFIETVVPSSGENINILENIAIDPGNKHTYTLTITYKNKDKDQSSDSSKKLLGKLEIVEGNIENLISSNYISSKFSSTNTEGLIKINQPATTQMKATTEYRYSGSNNNVKNYVSFNDELWRIIGVFEVDDGNDNYQARMKIMRDESIGGYSYDSSSGSLTDDGKYIGINRGWGINQWSPTKAYEGADLMRLLNSGYTGINGSLYYNSESGKCYAGPNNGNKNCDFTSSGLKEEAKSMIGDAKWYLGATPGDLAQNLYKAERANATGTADIGTKITKTSNWVGKVGLMYASDYAFSSSACYKTTSISSYSNANCIASNWIYNNDNMSTMTPDSVGNPWEILGMVTDGHQANGFQASRATTSVRPVVYLKPNIKIVNGDGSSLNPYELRS